MRWLGQMQRAFELMCAYSLERKVGGEALADKQTIQNWIAESAAEIQACRLMTLQTAHRLDEGDEARVEVSLIKFYAARVLHDVIDRALQVHGGLGMTEDAPLAAMYRNARGARIYDGADEVHKMVVARRILGRSRTAGPGASRSPEGTRVRLEPLEPAHEEPLWEAGAGRGRLALDARPRRQEPRGVSRLVRVDARDRAAVRDARRRRAARAHELSQRARGRPRR